MLYWAKIPCNRLKSASPKICTCWALQKDVLDASPKPELSTLFQQRENKVVLKTGVNME